MPDDLVKRLRIQADGIRRGYDPQSVIADLLDEAAARLSATPAIEAAVMGEREAILALSIEMPDPYDDGYPEYADQAWGRACEAYRAAIRARPLPTPPAEVAEQVLWHGQRLRPDDYKLIFLDALKRELRVVPNLDGNGFVNLGRSSSDLSKAEMGDLMTLIEEWGARHGVVFHDPAPTAQRDG